MTLCNLVRRNREHGGVGEYDPDAHAGREKNPQWLAKARREIDTSQCNTFIRRSGNGKETTGRKEKVQPKGVRERSAARRTAARLRLS